MKQNVKVIGVTGGIANGKSTIAAILESFGAYLIDADKICHEIINSKEIALEITNRWGIHLQDNHGKIKRDTLAKIVFSDKKEISALNCIIHPKAIEQIKCKIAELSAEAIKTVIVLDASLLVESNLIDICDVVLFVDTEKDRCKTRIQDSRKWAPNEITKREKFQNSLLHKRKISDVIINNNHSKNDTSNQLKDFWCQFITKNKFGE
jgi:dephospho-CoA kinase